MTLLAHPETAFESAVPRYDLDATELQSVVNGFLHEHEPKTDVSYACYRISGDDPAANIGRMVESTVFLETFGNTVDTMRTEYEPYESASTFFVSFDTKSRKAVGVLRVIENSDAGLMTLNDMADGVKDVKGNPITLPIEEAMSKQGIADLADCWDVGTVAVVPEYRGGRGSETAASIQLYRALYVSAMAQGIKHFVSIIDKAPLKQMTRFLGIPFKPLAGTPPIDYLGSTESQAVHGYVPDFYKMMDHHRRRTLLGRAAGPQLEKLMDGGRGMDESLQFFTTDQLDSIRRQSRQTPS